MTFTNKKTGTKFKEFKVENAIDATGCASIGATHLLIGIGVDDSRHLICAAWGEKEKDDAMIQRIIASDYEISLA